MAKEGFIESIRLVDARPQLLDYHQERVERSLRTLSPFAHLSLREHIGAWIEPKADSLMGVYKLRLEYDAHGFYKVSIQPYTARRVERLVPYEVPCVDFYRYKYSDRSQLPTYTSLGLQPSEEPILTHRGLLTDTSYSNLLLDMGDGRWLTPQRPLLEGVMRAYLIDSGRIHCAELSLADLERCRSFRLINAMLPLD